MLLINGKRYASGKGLCYSELNIRTFLAHDHEVLQIDLHGNKLKQFFGNDLPKLKSLNVSYNSLTLFKANYFRDLENLDLEHNKLSNIEGGSFQNLKSINFSYNKLKSIDLICPLHNLVSVNLGRNLITEIVNVHLPKLKHFDVQYNRITKFENNRFPELGTLYLSNNRLTKFEDNYLPLLEILNLSENLYLSSIQQRLPKLHTLSIHYTRVEFVDAKILKTVQGKDVHLREHAPHLLEVLRCLVPQPIFEGMEPEIQV